MSRPKPPKFVAPIRVIFEGRARSRTGWQETTFECDAWSLRDARGQADAAGICRIDSTTIIPMGAKS